MAKPRGSEEIKFKHLSKIDKTQLFMDAHIINCFTKFCNMKLDLGRKIQTGLEVYIRFVQSLPCRTPSWTKLAWLSHQIWLPPVQISPYTHD